MNGGYQNTSFWDEIKISQTPKYPDRNLPSMIPPPPPPQIQPYYHKPQNNQHSFQVPHIQPNCQVFNNIYLKQEINLPQPQQQYQQQQQYRQDIFSQISPDIPCFQNAPVPFQKNYNQQSNYKPKSQYIPHQRQNQYPQDNQKHSFHKQIKPQQQQYQQKKNPIQDSTEEIQKWIAQRKKRYPSSQPKMQQQEPEDHELSILEIKLRKKVRILSGSSRRLHIKMKQMKELCKQITSGEKEIKGRNNQVHQENHQKPQRSRGKIINGQKNEVFDVDDFFLKNDEQQYHLESPPVEQVAIQPTLGHEVIKAQMTEVEIKEEIQQIEQKLKSQKPKEFYKTKREGQELQQMAVGQKKKLKRRLKLLQSTLRNEQKDETKPNEGDHIKNMVDSLKSQRDVIQNFLEQSMNYKANPVNYRYKTNTLYASLVLDEIYKERSYLLQAIRFLIKSNFFDEVDEQESQIEIEEITPSSSGKNNDEVVSSSELGYSGNESD